MGAKQSKQDPTVLASADPASADPASTPAISKCPVRHVPVADPASDPVPAAPASDEQAPQAAPSSSPPSASKCPVDHKNFSTDGYNPTEFLAKAAAASGGYSADGSVQEAASYTTTSSPPPPPAPANKKKDKIVYDVYGNEIDPTNMMPKNLNHLPSPGQKTRLSTDRVQSSIPKGSVDPDNPKSGAQDADAGNWVYPSPQMFYNSLKRKGKGDDVKEEMMEEIVNIHNRMNERTWGEVLNWELMLHGDKCPNPKLLKFQGRPHELSPTAYFKTLMGYHKPFDRHDWTVDRCGTSVRYIIDYYYEEKKKDEPIWIYVRPAIDSIQSIIDRSRMWTGLYSRFQLTQPQPQPPQQQHKDDPTKHLPVLQSDAASVLSDEDFNFLAGLTPAQIKEIDDNVNAKCSHLFTSMNECKAANGSDAKECEKITIGANYCVAKGLPMCGKSAEAFLAVLAPKDASIPSAEKVSAAYAEMAKCMDRFSLMTKRVMQQGSGIAEQGPEINPTRVPKSAAVASPKE